MNFFFIPLFFFVLLLTSNIAVSGQFTACSDKKCPSSCFGIEGSDCSCVPKGCDSVSENNLSIDVVNKAYCKQGEVFCRKGTPTCKGNDKDLKPVCGGWLFGFRGGLSGPGCAKRYARRYSHFDKGALYCREAGLPSPKSTNCNKKVLCNKKSKRKQSCREDRFLCKCICPFDFKNQKHTPSCDINDRPTCPNNLTPICSLSTNVVGCEGGKLYCKHVLSGVIDLQDKIICK